MKQVLLSLFLFGCCCSLLSANTLPKLPQTVENRVIHFYDVKNSVNSSLSAAACKRLFKTAYYQLTPDRQVLFKKDQIFNNFKSYDHFTLSSASVLKHATVMANFSWHEKSYQTKTWVDYFVIQMDNQLNAYAFWKNDYCKGAYVSYNESA